MRSRLPVSILLGVRDGQKLFFVMLAALCLNTLSGCGNDPFSYVPVSGKVTYEDGSLIPGDDLQLFFYPIGGELNAKTHPRPGQAIIDPATGQFSEVTSHKPGAGLVPGKYKVTVYSREPNIVPREYTIDTKTPLEVDTASVPFDIKVPKPKK